MKKVYRGLVILTIFGMSSFLSSSSSLAGCNYEPHRPLVRGTCTWGEIGHYCDIMVTPYISCTQDHPMHWE